MRVDNKSSLDELSSLDRRRKTLIIKKTSLSLYYIKRDKPN